MKKSVGLVSVLLVLAAGGFLAYGWSLIHQPYKGYAEEVVLEVPWGLGSEEIVNLLHSRGVIQYSYPALVYLYFSPYRGRLQAGEYLFNEPMDTPTVFRMLAEGSVRLYTLTLPEGLRLAQIADRWETAGFGSRDDFLEAAEAAVPSVREIDPSAVSLEGYLFPETYSFPKGITSEEAVEAMIDGFEAAVMRLEQTVPRETWPLDLNRTLILASLIESEAAVAEERVLISSVFLNRLSRRMRLECDPTVIYALIQDGSYRGRLLRADLSFDSPYNTYVYGDLPPGPISNPGYLSMLAAVQPAETDYLYFVRTDGGRHTFSRTLAEHNTAVAAYRRSVQ